MPWINTKEMDPAKFGAMETLWVYNALDAALTFEIRDAVAKLLDNQTRATYEYSKSLQAAVLDMMKRGVKVDLSERDSFLRRLEEEETWLRTRLDEMARTLWGRGLNPASPKAVKEFFYDFLKMPVQLKKDKASGQKKPTTDREALETLGNYFEASIFVSHILAIREVHKLASTLRSEVDPDGRMRTSFNIAGTETGRFSSSSSAFDTGTNLQNQTEQLRRIYTSDPGKKLAYIDLEQAESRAVGYICKVLGLGSTYLDACTSGDLHTTTCRLVWPDLGWTGGPSDRDIAERPFYRHFSYRDMSKRGGHGTNYYGTPWTMAKHLKVAQKLIEVFQVKYFAAFPEIREWHKWTARELQLTGQITNLYGDRRTFFGRASDDSTLREAIAHNPQSSIAKYTNLCLREVHRRVKSVEVLLQVHDALLIQYDEAVEAEAIEHTRAVMGQVTLGESGIVIPTDCAVGWNWAKVDTKKKFWTDGNPFGLTKYKGRDDRQFKKTSLLDRRVS